MKIDDYFKDYPYLTKEDIQAFKDVLIPSKLAKGEFLITEGKISRHIAYIQSGIFRSFYYSSDHEPVTYCFTFSNTLITAYTSWILQTPTNENIEALTDMELLLISKESLDQLMLSNSKWIRFFKDIAEMEYINLEKRIFMLQKESAETRYSELMKEHPEYLHLIPLKYLASYLGVTQRHLSRIRKRFSN